MGRDAAGIAAVIFLPVALLGVDVNGDGIEDLIETVYPIWIPWDDWGDGDYIIGLNNTDASREYQIQSSNNNVNWLNETGWVPGTGNGQLLWCVWASPWVFHHRCVTTGIAELTSQTAATVPSNRSRTTRGVGEQVTVNSNFSSSPVTWSITSGNGTLSSGSVTSVTFTAPDRAGNTTVKGTKGSKSATITFTTIEPSGVTMERLMTLPTFHISGLPSAGFIALVYITPSNVSFENIQVREKSVNGVAINGLSCHNGLPHNLGPWVNVNEVVAGKGSKQEGGDLAKFGFSCGTPHQNGTFTFNIPMEFRVGTGTPKTFTTQTQQGQLTSTGKFTTSKAGVSVSHELNDPTNTSICPPY